MAPLRWGTGLGSIVASGRREGVAETGDRGVGAIPHEIHVFFIGIGPSSQERHLSLGEKREPDMSSSGAIGGFSWPRFPTYSVTGPVHWSDGARCSSNTRCDTRGEEEDSHMHEPTDSQNEQTCHRCFCREYIPTYQFVKFDNQVKYLCQKCWEDYRRWFHWGTRPTPSRPPMEM